MSAPEKVKWHRFHEFRDQSPISGLFTFVKGSITHFVCSSLSLWVYIGYVFEAKKLKPLVTLSLKGQQHGILTCIQFHQPTENIYLGYGSHILWQNLTYLIKEQKFRHKISTGCKSILGISAVMEKDSNKFYVFGKTQVQLQEGCNIISKILWGESVTHLKINQSAKHQQPFCLIKFQDLSYPSVITFQQLNEALLQATNSNLILPTSSFFLQKLKYGHQSFYGPDQKVEEVILMDWYGMRVVLGEQSKHVTVFQIHKSQSIISWMLVKTLQLRVEFGLVDLHLFYDHLSVIHEQKHIFFNLKSKQLNKYKIKRNKANRLQDSFQWTQCSNGLIICFNVPGIYFHCNLNQSLKTDCANFQQN